MNVRMQVMAIHTLFSDIIEVNRNTTEYRNFHVQFPSFNWRSQHNQIHLKKNTFSFLHHRKFSAFVFVLFVKITIPSSLFPFNINIFNSYEVQLCSELSVLKCAINNTSHYIYLFITVFPCSLVSFFLWNNLFNCRFR